MQGGMSTSRSSRPSNTVSLICGSFPGHTRCAHGDRCPILGASRQILLKHGEAWFEVARDATRPFTVLAGGGAITALGTEFNVDLDAEQDHITVTVSSGFVEVRPAAERRAQPGSNQSPDAAPSAAWMPERLGVGQSLSYGRKGPKGTVRTADMRPSAHGRKGALNIATRLWRR